MPLNRDAVEDFELGYKEPTRVPYGKVTLRNAIKFITNHQHDPVKYSAENIAEDYNLPIGSVSKYFVINFYTTVFVLQLQKTC